MSVKNLTCVNGLMHGRFDDQILAESATLIICTTRFKYRLKSLNLWMKKNCPI